MQCILPSRRHSQVSWDLAQEVSSPEPLGLWHLWRLRLAESAYWRLESRNLSRWAIITDTTAMAIVIMVTRITLTNKLGIPAAKAFIIMIWMSPISPKPKLSAILMLLHAAVTVDRE